MTGQAKGISITKNEGLRFDNLSGDDLQTVAVTGESGGAIPQDIVKIQKAFARFNSSIDGLPLQSAAAFMEAVQRAEGLTRGETQGVFDLKSVDRDLSNAVKIAEKGNYPFGKERVKKIATEAVRKYFASVAKGRAILRDLPKAIQIGKEFAKKYGVELLSLQIGPLEIL